VVALQSILLVDPAEKMDSMNLLLRMAPMAFVLLIPVVALLEPSSALDVVQRLQLSSDFRGLLLCNCLLAFFANLLNFLIIRATSALTLQVCFPRSPLFFPLTEPLQYECVPSGL
jgi:hypothetical protein